MRTVFDAKRRKGQWIGSEAPYGYMKDENNKNHLVPNPATAPVVREIFNLALAGKNTSEIAKNLNNSGIETPAEYFSRTHPDSKKFTNVPKQACWNTVNVKRILRTRLYTGAIVSNTRTRKSINTPQSHKNDMSEWIVVPNCHEAIVTDKEFQKAQSAIRKYSGNGIYAPTNYPLRSLVTCGICGRAMMRHPQGKRKYYICSRSVSDSSTECPVKEKFYETDIETAVISDLREKLRLFVDNQRRIADAQKQTHGTEANIRVCISRLERQLKQKSFERKSAYERYVDEVISKDEFMAIKSKLTNEEEILKHGIEQYTCELQHILEQKNNGTEKIEEIAEDYLSKDNFTNEMLLYFIDKVKVYSGGKIEIVCRFKDLFDTETIN